MIKKESVEPLHEERKKLHEKLAKVNKAIKALQDLCDHDFVEDGHDSHKTHYKCSICSKEESW